MITAEPGTIRPGGHWRVTIVNEGVQPPDATGHRPDAQLLAVVMAGKVLTTDPELAAKVAALLTIDGRCWHGEHCFGSGPDCERDAPLKGGHRDCAAAWHSEHGCCTGPYDLAAATTGNPRCGHCVAESHRCPACVDREGPETGLRSTVAAEGVSGVAGSGVDASNGAEISPGGFTLDAVALFSGEGVILLGCTRCSWSAQIEDQLTLAELNQRADEHTEVCR